MCAKILSVPTMGPLEEIDPIVFFQLPFLKNQPKGRFPVKRHSAESFRTVAGMASKPNYGQGPFSRETDRPTQHPKKGGFSFKTPHPPLTTPIPNPIPPIPSNPRPPQLARLLALEGLLPGAGAGVYEGPHVGAVGRREDGLVRHAQPHKDHLPRKPWEKGEGEIGGEGGRKRTRGGLLGAKTQPPGGGREAKEGNRLSSLWCPFC